MVSEQHRVEGAEGPHGRHHEAKGAMQSQKEDAKCHDCSLAEEEPTRTGFEQPARHGVRLPCEISSHDHQSEHGIQQVQDENAEPENQVSARQEIEVAVSRFAFTPTTDASAPEEKAAEHGSRNVTAIHPASPFDPWPGYVRVRSRIAKRRVGGRL